MADSAADTDVRIRAAEARLFAHYGIAATERMVPVPSLGLRVRVLDIDGDRSRPPIVLLHGIASVTAAAAPLIPLLGGARIVAVDLPGHGLSDPLVLDARKIRSVLASVVEAVVDDLGGGPVDLVAHSLGGETALYFVLAHPQKVRRLVLLGAPGAGFEGVTPVAAMRLFSVPGVGRLILSLPASLEAYNKNSEGMLGPHALDGYPPEIAEVGWLASKRPGFAHSVSSYFRALITPTRVRPGVAVSLAELATIAVPTLMVWGDADVFLTPDAGRASIEAIPGSRLVEVVGGHAPWLDQLDTTGAAIADFLA